MVGENAKMFEFDNKEQSDLWTGYLKNQNIQYQQREFKHNDLNLAGDAKEKTHYSITID
ncbi:MAG: hypothetical protein ABIP27_10650 [Flavobacterium circumlabens]|uniref:hypothetical protein n=1 Tax=Flavobacterium circumlabens TaxID=2133765 RepID=UPI0032640395